VLFGLDRAACGEDEEEFLMKKVKRAFRTVDKEDTGFVALDALGTVIRALGMKKGMPVPSAAEIQSLASILDTAGAGIVLWSDFTAPAIQLLRGKTVAEIQSDDGSRNSGGGRRGGGAVVDLSNDGFSGNAVVSLDPIPLHSPNITQTIGAKRPRLERTDSDYARELYEQLNPGMSTALPSDLLGSSSSSSSSAALPTGAEAAASALLTMGGDGAGDNNLGSVNSSSSSISLGAGAGIRLFHYNGMKRTIRGEEKGPRLTSCKLWKRVAFGVLGLTTGSSRTAIDDTMRTKWKGAEIEWTDGQAGNING